MTYLRILLTAFLAIAGTMLSSAAMAALEKRIALVIGNGAYSNAPSLANPVADARAMAAKMRKLGFEVVEGYDLDKIGVENTVRTFANRAKSADLSLFYYAGHGIAVENKNYIVPVDARFEDSAALDFEAVPVGLVTRNMQYSQGVSLVFLDACRDNPLAKTLSRSMGSGTRSAGIGSGLAAMKITNPGKGLAIAFATSPGAVAYDGEGDHSPFTTALLKHIDEPNTDITEIMSRVTGEVVRSTNQKQRPWLNTSLTGSVILNKVEELTADKPAAPIKLGKKAVAETTDTLELQKVLYDLARETGQADDYKAYLDKFPNGLFSANARRSLERIQPEKQQKVKVATLGDVESPSLVLKPVEQKPLEMVEDTEPLKLTANIAVSRMPANAQIETELEMDADKRVEVQKRLTVAGFNPGPADGIFGKGTRKALGDWQEKSGLEVSGYLNEPQLQMLMQQTETKLASYVPVSTKPVAKKVVRSKPKVTKSRSVKKKRVTKRKTVRKKRTTKRRVARRTTRRDSRRRQAERDRRSRRAQRRHYRDYDDYDDRRRRRTNGIVAGAIVGGAIGIAIGRKKN